MDNYKHFVVGSIFIIQFIKYNRKFLFKNLNLETSLGNIFIIEKYLTTF